jgi:hypothetical protein
MSTKSKTYAVCETNFLRQTGRGMWIGSVFKDHGRTMRVTAIGKAYGRAKERLIEITAIETSDGR